MITLFLFLSLLILLIRIFSARLIIPAVGVFLPVSSLWMGFHMLTENESWSVQYSYRMVFDCGININRMCWRIFSP